MYLCGEETSENILLLKFEKYFAENNNVTFLFAIA